MKTFYLASMHKWQSRVSGVNANIKQLHSILACKSRLLGQRSQALDVLQNPQALRQPSQATRQVCRNRMYRPDELQSTIKAVRDEQSKVAQNQLASEAFKCSQSWT